MNLLNAYNCPVIYRKGKRNESEFLFHIPCIHDTHHNIIIIRKWIGFHERIFIYYTSNNYINMGHNKAHENSIYITEKILLQLLFRENLSVARA